MKKPQYDHHYLLWLYVKGYGSHDFRRLVLAGFVPNNPLARLYFTLIGGRPYRDEYLEGREARMEGLKLRDNPYCHQPHDAARRDAWSTGWKDEDTWALDSTGR